MHRERTTTTGPHGGASASAEEIRAALARPDTYPGGPDRVEVHETHISWVFVVGDRAYKLKKPIVLPFLDYATAERRLRFCRDEVRLNSVLAPDVYLGVRSVIAGPDGIELADEDHPAALDYLVEMRRYDERLTLSSKLERGELTADDVEAVAQTLAAFHAQARRAPPSDASSLVLERRMAESSHELLAVVEQRAELRSVLALERFAHEFAIAHAQLLDARGRDGMVREVHGDLRAEHVLLEREPKIVDCVEFDLGLRQLDVADDLAFLVMDLVARGGERFARVLVDAYRRAGGDPGEDRLIAFYGAHRALVRAKVSLVRAAQLPATSSGHGHDSAEARDLLGLAERFAWQARLPLAIAVCGSPAAGKSRLAEVLAELSRLPLLSSDLTRKRLAGIKPQQRGRRVLYSEEFNRLTYTELGRRAAAEVRAVGGAIVDATFRHRADRDAFSAAFGDAAAVVFVECRAPARVLAERAAGRDRRPGGVSDATLQVVLREREVWEPLDEVTPEAHLILRSDRSVEVQLEDLRALLDRRIGALRGVGSPGIADRA